MGPISQLMEVNSAWYPWSSHPLCQAPSGASAAPAPGSERRCQGDGTGRFLGGTWGFNPPKKIMKTHGFNH